MPTFLDPPPEQRQELERIAAGIPEVQSELTSKHPELAMADRGAHQQQLAASKVSLSIADVLPAELDGLGVFERGTPQQISVGRISTGMGCPHAETDADWEIVPELSAELIRPYQQQRATEHWVPEVGELTVG